MKAEDGMVDEVAAMPTYNASEPLPQTLAFPPTSPSWWAVTEVERLSLLRTVWTRPR